MDDIDNGVLDILGRESSVVRGISAQGDSMSIPTADDSFLTICRPVEPKAPQASSTPTTICKTPPTSRRNKRPQVSEEIQDLKREKLELEVEKLKLEIVKLKRELDA